MPHTYVRQARIATATLYKRMQNHTAAFAVADGKNKTEASGRERSAARGKSSASLPAQHIIDIHVIYNIHI